MRAWRALPRCVVPLLIQIIALPGVLGAAGPVDRKTAAGATQEGDAPPRDFSRPDQTFATTLAESFASLDLPASALYELLRVGELIILDTHPSTRDVPWLSTSAIIVEAPASLAYTAMSDVDRYSEFVPQVTSSHAVPVVDGIDQVFLELSIHVLLAEVKNRYSLYYYYQPPSRLDWILAEGEFEANCGSFELVSLPGTPARSILFHTSYALPRNKLLSALFSRVPDLDLMINLTTGTLMIEAMKKRAEKLYAEAGGSSVPEPVPPDRIEWLRARASILARLAGRGDVFMLDRSGPVIYSSVARIQRPVDEVFYATTHLDELAATNPYLTARYLERGRDSARVEVESTISLMIDFDAEYVLNVVQEPPNRSWWTGEPSGDLAGVAGGWELVSLGPQDTLAIYRNTSDLKSHGFTMRKLLGLEPVFEHAIHITETRRMIDSLKAWRPGPPPDD